MLWIYDIEIYPNFFSATFKDYNTKEVKQFVTFKDRNDIEELLKFIDNPNLWLAGYNSSHFDNQLLKYMMENKFMYYDENSSDIANHIYKFAKTVICFFISSAESAITHNSSSPVLFVIFLFACLKICANDPNKLRFNAFYLFVSNR